MKIKGLLYFFLTILIILLNTCDEKERLNPWDKKNTLDPNEWALTKLEIEVVSITERKLTWHYGDHSIEGFKIDRKEGNNDWKTAYATLDKEARNWNDINIVPNASLTYSYRVYAFAGDNVSAYVEVEYVPLAVTTSTVTNISTTFATSGGNVVGSHVDIRGIAYDTSPNPNISGNTVPAGSGAGSFTANLTGLTPGTNYYARAYATNNAGTIYGYNESFKTIPPCGTDITFIYKGQQVTYGTIERGGLCWMDRNLGASRVPISITDSQGYGDLFQWGRLDDGHQNRGSGTISTLSNSDVPGHGDFITTGSSPFDWRSPQNNNLWQGEDGINNICPEGWRMPTDIELNAERLSWSSNNSEGAYASTLKWPVGGFRYYDGTVSHVGSFGYVWSSNIIGNGAMFLYFHSAIAGMQGSVRANGKSVRCVRNN